MAFGLVPLVIGTGLVGYGLGALSTPYYWGYGPYPGPYLGYPRHFPYRW